MKKSERGDKWRDLGDVGGVGIEFVVSIALGYYAGHWLDGKYFHDKGWATGIGALLGVYMAFKAIFDAAKRARLRLEELEREEHERGATRSERDHDPRR